MANPPKTLKMQAEEAYHKQDFEKAEALFRQALANLELAIGDQCFEVAAVLHCLARTLEKLGRLDESRATRERADKILCDAK